MHIVIGCPIRNRAWVLPEWLEAIRRQNIKVDIVCMLSPSEDETEKILRDNDVLVLNDRRPGRDQREIIAHGWGDLDTYAYMASLRNKLIKYAQYVDADYFFSLDSDILLPFEALERLLEYAKTHPGVVAPAVNMVFNGTQWNTMNWVRSQPGRALRENRSPQTGRADVIMAAMLLDRSAMQCAWAAHEQGEDIGFCLDAEAKDVDRWWVREVWCEHLMYRF